MSNESVELVREIYDVFHSGELDPAIDRLLVPDFEGQVPEIFPEKEPFRRRDGARRWIEALEETWSEWRWELEELVPVGGSVLVFARLVTKGRASGVELDREVAHLWEIRGDRAAGVRVFFDRAEAREAVGLPASGD